MINRQKVTLMARAAEYEKAEGRIPLKLEKSLRPGQRSLFRMKNVLFGLAGYVLILLLAVLGVYYTEGLSPEVNNSFLAGILMIATGVVFVLLYSVFAETVCRHQYEDVKNSMRDYYETARKLKDFYEAEETDEDSADV